MLQSGGTENNWHCKVEARRTTDCHPIFGQSDQHLSKPQQNTLHLQPLTEERANMAKNKVDYQKRIQARMDPQDVQWCMVKFGLLQTSCMNKFWHY